MKKMWIITVSTLKMLIRNKQSLFFTLFLPLALMVIIGYVTNTADVAIRLGVVTDVQYAPPPVVLDALNKVDVLKISQGTLAEEKAALNDNQRDLLVQFSPNAQVVTGPQTVTFYENVSKPSESNIGEMIIQQTLQQMQLALTKTAPLYTFAHQEISAQGARYIDFLVPGIIAMTIMQLGIFGTAFAIVTAKEKGILKRIMAAPIKSWQYIGGNVLARLTLSFVQAGILVAVAKLIFDVQFFNWGWLALLVILGNVIFLSLGLFLSGVAKTTESVPLLGNLIVFPMLLLGGVFFPTGNLPEWLKIIVDKLPIAVLADIMRETVTSGKSLAEVWGSLLWLIGWSLLCLFLASVFFKMQEKD
ncbi:MAG: hypothetical protein A2233_05485 [Candidatus Kerfeldbacteria bacterium RIFOXYA2_FULL_38_24]|uniref:Transport permease protein n=1 Tax=Candidatus Kerfeldbacteria bacterium RIFOXYB2_FULL_38_14 TaxID=1798547 RepID=A0A1G2BIA2_9BACT|nr:MAG: hypothetical protein A2233_05485 [Candidatus Kerfeldbacteria bacterium RIFOXYA2_FULL_38_24]OGY88279.1 MAG: hypothetical protein A2319_03770 [Candidatus Kerfeldbacteria bacterium RIFOXYB2_FULL_38_14]